MFEDSPPLTITTTVLSNPPPQPTNQQSGRQARLAQPTQPPNPTQHDSDPRTCGDAQLPCRAATNSNNTTPPPDTAFHESAVSGYTYSQQVPMVTGTANTRTAS
ncbi:hypothetical protein [Mycobacterium leprae]|uniref:hypothetical protein n=1 Tax=Mycobacterium leprae TaxID=1769 RepID=UPI000A82A69E|nr:hypothetical protein [Mycobacterium leprae]